MLRSVAKFGATGTAAACVGGYVWAKKTMGSDAIDRIITFDMMAVPAVIEYKYWEARCEKLPKSVPWLFPPISIEEETEHYEQLHKKYAPQMRDVYMKLGGFYYKSGQKVASNMGGFVPKTYQDICQPFLNDIPARDPGEIRAVVEAELGRPREEVFATWDDTPIGCASIGQVHRATLKSNGRKVVVKVQNPEAERTFHGDVFALKTLMDVAMPQLSITFDEIQKQFATEFDYRGECQNAIDIRENLKKSGYDVIVPEVFPELCSAKLMVMEEISPSTPLHHALDQQAERMAKQQNVSKEEFIAAEKARVEAEALRLAKEGKVLESLSARDYNKYIAFQRFKQWAWKWTLGWFRERGDDGGIVVPMNAAKLIDELLAVHGHEILIDGVFNADPHPGNVLCADGKIALIDYGQVKRIDDKQRLDLAKLIMLVGAAIKVDPRVNPNVKPEVHARARKAIASFAREIGMKTEKDLDDTYYDMCVVYFGRMDAAFLYPRNAIQWSDWIQERDPLENIDNVDYFIMVSTASMMLRGLGEMLQQYRNLAECWGPMAKMALKEKDLLDETEKEINSWTAA